MNDIKRKLSATVCFILRTKWHHHVVTSLHARACSLSYSLVYEVV